MDYSYPPSYDTYNAVEWYNKGVALHELKKYNEAIECYDRAIKIDPNYAYVWNDKGLSLDKLGRHLSSFGAYFNKLNNIASNHLTKLKCIEWYENRKDCHKQVNTMLKKKISFILQKGLTNCLSSYYYHYYQYAIKYMWPSSSKHSNIKERCII